MNASLALGISVLCSVLIAHVLRVAKQNNSVISAVLMVNYAIASVIALINAEIQAVSFWLIGIGILTGVFFIANFFLFAESVKQNGLGISVVAMRLSLSVPILGSLVFFKEQVSIWGWIGFGLIGVSLHLIQGSSKLKKHQNKVAEIEPIDNFRGNEAACLIKTGDQIQIDWEVKEQDTARPKLLLLLFLLSGFGDFALKLFERLNDSQMNSSAFMSIVFGTAFIVSIIKLYNEKTSISRKDWLTGIALGVPNVFSSLFLIQALIGLKAVFVYPTANTLVIIIGSILGVWYWKDHLTKKQWLGIGTAIVAIITLMKGV
jgi:drug/metabolite transporter (DMT)-like permease